MIAKFQREMITPLTAKYYIVSTSKMIRDLIKSPNYSSYQNEKYGYETLINDIAIIMVLPMEKT